MALRRNKRAKQQIERQKQQNAPDNRLILNSQQQQQLNQIKFAPTENTVVPEVNNIEKKRMTPQELETVQAMADNPEWEQYVINVAENPPITEKTVRQAMERLKKYRSDKNNLEKRLIANEDYWKLRQWNYIDDKNKDKKKKIATAWLWNCISSKHADLMDGFPESNIRPKRADDIEEANKLKSIIPIIFEENDYENIYSKLCNYILKQGTCAVGVFWDGTKHDGLGDIIIKKVDLLELFWESGISDIQESKEVFHTKYESNEKLLKSYPQLQGKLGGKSITISEYHYDDNIDTTNKSLLIDWYYKLTDENGKEILHYCKFVNGIVLFSSENEPTKYPNGWYDHGLYPFIITPLFPVEGTIAGFGYSDIGRGDQEAIDILTSAILTNAMVNSKPRYMIKNGASGINEAEFADWNKSFVHIEGSLDETNVREINASSIPSYVINMRDRLIDEMKETLGNRDVSNGGSTSGVTAASAIAAMQEQSGKLSRTHNKTMYVMHKTITQMIIELIRQFYDIPREYRITGEMGKDEFINYDNRGLKPQQQPSILGIQMGLRLPCFDIEVSAQKATPYSKLEQNELAIQLYNLGVFSPQNVDMAMALLQTMDFSHKDDIIQRVSANGTMLQKYQQLQKVAFQLAQAVDPQLAEILAQAIFAENGQNPVPNESADINLSTNGEHAFVEKARANARNSTQVEK